MEKKQKKKFMKEICKMENYKGYDVLVELENELIRFSKKLDEIVKRMKEEGK